MSGAHRLLLPFVYAVVQGAPPGNAEPALRQAVRSVDVFKEMLGPVAATM
jgi:hypothetical protein